MDAFWKVAIFGGADHGNAEKATNLNSLGLDGLTSMNRKAKLVVIAMIK